ncbi:hypothetical protein CFC21_106121 [Triticum aestivum]|uniref:GCK domain-containing protein n=2 Tax=Triticum aestivum TaxID=4565 RepID=A0A9R1N991_WHEAT|nr:hypothetical protein CFC21_106121 [Triticum aestivum]
MGIVDALLTSAEAIGKELGQAITANTEFISDKKCVEHHVANGGCIDEFITAVDECHPRQIKTREDPDERVLDVDACVKATAALRECFEGNRLWFAQQYIRRMDEGLDEDRKPSPEKVEEEELKRFRWWTGMRRS